MRRAAVEAVGEATEVADLCPRRGRRDHAFVPYVRKREPVRQPANCERSGDGKHASPGLQGAAAGFRQSRGHPLRQGPLPADWAAWPSCCLAGNGFWLGLGVGPPTEARAGAVRLANGVLPDDAAIRADGVLATPQPLTLNPSAATRASAWPRRRRRADLLPFQFITS